MYKACGKSAGGAGKREKRFTKIEKKKKNFLQLFLFLFSVFGFGQKAAFDRYQYRWIENEMKEND